MSEVDAFNFLLGLFGLGVAQTGLLVGVWFRLGNHGARIERLEEVQDIRLAHGHGD